jgi:hypothetical protein
MRLIDQQFLETPWYGSRQMARHLRRNGWCVVRHRAHRCCTVPTFCHQTGSSPYGDCDLRSNPLFLELTF